MTVKHITGRDNALVKKTVKLCESARARRDAGLFPVMGEPFLLNEAIERGCDIETVIWLDEAYEMNQSGDNRAQELSLQTNTVPANLMRFIAPLESLPKVIFLCRLPSHVLHCGLFQANRHLILDGVQDPGNTGTLLRTAAAFGFTSVILTEECADPYAPKVTRAASGAHFRVSVYTAKRIDLSVLLSQSPLPIWAAERSGGALPPSVLSQSGILILGSEAHGVSPELKSSAHGSVAVDIQGDSLNVAVAGGILMYEMMKRGECVDV